MNINDGNKTDNIDVAYVANLARLELNDQEKITFQSQLDSIVGYCSKIRELDLAGIEPTSHAVPIYNIFRDDDVKDSIARDAVLRNAPSASSEQFLVPVIIE